MPNIYTSTGDEFTPKAPTECIIHLASASQAALKGETDKQKKKFILEEQRTLFNRWMAHDLTIESTKAYLAKLEKKSKELQLSNISDLAKRLSDRLVDPEKLTDPNISEQEKGNGIYPLLHNNMYGRAFESEFVNELVKNPPQGVKVAMQMMGKGVYDLIKDTQKFSKLVEEATNGDYKSSFPKHFIEAVKDSIEKKPATWRNKLLELGCFLEKGSEESLKSMLDRDIKSGEQSILIPYLSVKLFEELAVQIISMNSMTTYIIDQNKKESVKKQLDQFSWIKDANGNYTKKIKNYKGLAKFNDHPVNNRQNKASGTGISLIHQTILIQDKELIPGQCPSTTYMPDFQANTNTHKLALKHGIPFVSGVSGSTNIML